jgi:hypothetical protein
MRRFNSTTRMLKAHAAVEKAFLSNKKSAIEDNTGRNIQAL